MKKKIYNLLDFNYNKFNEFNLAKNECTTCCICMCPIGICCMRGKIREIRKIEVVIYFLNFVFFFNKKIYFSKGNALVDFLATACKIFLFKNKIVLR